MLVIPGGVVSAELQREAVIDWIARTASSSTITASVCTGAFLLGRAGLLRGMSATTHWEDIADLRSMFPDVDVQTERRWVDMGRVVTSAGISAGIDMSLHIVSRLESQELAIRTANRWNSIGKTFPMISVRSEHRSSRIKVLTHWSSQRWKK